MKYLLFSVLLAAGAAAVAQQAGPEKDITLQSPAELGATAVQLEQQILQQPGNADLHAKLGFTYTRLGRADDAQRAFENAVRLDPKKAIAYYMLGLIYEKKGLRDKAITAWKACLEHAQEQRLRDTAVKHLNNLGAK